MLKIADLVVLVNKFYKDAEWELSLVKNAKESRDLLATYDDWDIKNKELSDQFESFINAYKELMDTISINPENLNIESFHNAAQLVDTLNTRYERIMNNPYLNEDEDWYEDVDPGEFSEFLSAVLKDAETKFKAIVGEDIDISEMRANQYAAEFNNSNFEQTGVEGEKNLQWTGDKVDQALKARQNYYEKQKFDKKLNPEKYRALVEQRKQNWKIFRAKLEQNPELLAEFQRRLKDRQQKFQDKLKKRPAEIKKELQKTMGPTRRKELEEELAKLEHQLEKTKQNRKKHDQIKMQQFKDSTFDALIVQMMTTIASKRKDIKVVIKKKLALSENFLFKPIKDKLNDAKNREDSAAILAITAELEKAIDNFAKNDENFIMFNEESKKYDKIREMFKIIDQNGWMNNDVPLELISGPISTAIEESKSILKTDNPHFKSTNKKLASIVELLQNRITPAIRIAN